MKSHYLETDKKNHTCIGKYSNFNLSKAIESMFGKTNFLERHETRPWFTSLDGMYLRNDLLNDPKIVVLLLKHL